MTYAEVENSRHLSELHRWFECQGVPTGTAGEFAKIVVICADDNYKSRITERNEIFAEYLASKKG
jgi:hypothetical protein